MNTLDLYLQDKIYIVANKQIYNGCMIELQHKTKHLKMFVDNIRTPLIYNDEPELRRKRAYQTYLRYLLIYNLILRGNTSLMSEYLVCTIDSINGSIKQIYVDGWTIMEMVNAGLPIKLIRIMMKAHNIEF